MSNVKKQVSWWSKFDCTVCGGKAIGINFGARTCAPCKAFFRRNARRKEILEIPCTFKDPMNPLSCSQIRYCSACRLRRCFEMGMKESLIRSAAENERYRLLIQTNRERRRTTIIQNGIDQRLWKSDFVFLDEIDSKDLTDVRSTYESRCLKMYLQGRVYHPTVLTNHSMDVIHYYTMTTMNNMTSFMSFVLSVPQVQSLTKSNRRDLCQRNVRSLILLNANELNQLCFTDATQTENEKLAMKFICGDILYDEFLRTKLHLEQHLINDPVVTRLWLVVLFLSSSLECRFAISPPTIPHQNVFQLQQRFTTLLWKYLCHRYNNVDALRIFTNLIGLFLRLQEFSQRIDEIIQTRADLRFLDRKLCRAVTID